MERGNFTPIELTGISQNAYSSGRGIFMPEGSAAQEVRPQPARTTKVESHRSSTAKVENIDPWRQWKDELGKDFDEPGARSTVRLLVEEGILPNTITSRERKGQTITSKQEKTKKVQRAGEVVKTSLLSDDDRLARAEELVGFKLNDNQKKAVLEAHYAGQGSVFNVSKEDLLKKIRILEKAGFSKEERRTLIEAGVEAAAGPRPVDTIRGEAFPEFRSELANLFNDPTVRAVLATENPDFTQLPPEFNNFMNKWVNASEMEYSVFADLVAEYSATVAIPAAGGGPPIPGYELAYFDNIGINNTNPNRPFYEGIDNHIQISERARELLFEWTLERMIGVPDLGPEEAHYNIGKSIQLNENQDRIGTLLRTHFNRHFAEKLQTLQEVRPIMHDLIIAVNNSEDYTKYVAGMRMHGLDFVRNKVAGVDKVIEGLERAADYRISAAGRAFNDEDIEIIEKEVRTQLEYLQGQGELKDDTGRPLTDWELRRAMKFGKAYFAGTQRFGMYTIYGELPGQTTARIGSYPYEYIVRKLQGVKSIAFRFWGSDVGSGWFLKRILNAVKQGEKGPKGTGARSRTIYGINPDVMLLNNEYSVFDLIDSHSWRSLLTYTGNIDVETTDPATGITSARPLLEHLNSSLIHHGAVIDPNLGITKEGDTEAVSAELTDHFLGQRLFLSTFVRNVPISNELKGKIWQKIATLSPLHLASIRPEMLYPVEKRLLDDAVVNPNSPLPLRARMAIAEQMRVRDDQSLYFDENGEVRPQNIADLHAESARYQYLIDTENNLRRIGLNSLNEDDRKFYEDCRRGYRLDTDRDNDNLDLSDADYKRWLRLDADVLRIGRASLNPAEQTNYDNAVQNTKYRLLSYFDNARFGNGLSPDEEDLVKKIIDSGSVFGEELGKTRLPYTTGIDDAPKIALRKRGIGAGIAGLGDTNLVRVVGDQDVYGEGFTAFNGWTELPTEGYVEKPVEMTTKWARVIGREAAQLKTAYVVSAFAEGTIMKESARWIGSIMKGAGIPRSKWTEFYPDSTLAWEGKQRHGYVRDLGEKGTLNSRKNITEDRFGVVKKVIGEEGYTYLQKSRFKKLFEKKVSQIDLIERKRKARPRVILLDSILNYLQALFPELFAQIFKTGGESLKDSTAS